MTATAPAPKPKFTVWVQSGSDFIRVLQSPDYQKALQRAINSGKEGKFTILSTESGQSLAEFLKTEYISLIDLN